MRPTSSGMKRELVLTPDRLDETALIAARPADSALGAALTFSGIVRDLEGATRIAGIDYEAFRPMAEHQFRLLFDQVEARWPQIASLRLWHRLGPVPAGETSLWVEVRSPHRAEAFAATLWLIDEMKKVVPIWKRPLPAVAPA